MPNIRINFPDELNLKNEQVGIGTNDPTARLDVRGNILADNSVGGDNISTITRYDGFLNETQTLYHNLSVSQDSKGNLNSLSGEIVIEDEVTITDDTPLTGGRLDSLTVTGKFDLPHGGTEDREDTPEKGSTRFNQDLGQLEFYTGYEWRTVNSYARGAAGRGINAGNRNPATNMDQIQYINIQSLGNAIDFGVLTTDAYDGAGCSSETRGIFALGVDHPAVSNIIEYITIPSAGNSIDFGNLSETRLNFNSGSSSTRGIFVGGQTPTNSDTIDYIEIGTLGNALDFGNLTDSRREGGCVTSPTRLVHIGGFDAPSTNTTDMQFLTIASKGNAVFFGDTNEHSGNNTGFSNGTRGVFGGGSGGGPGGFNEKIDFITIATSGNSISFGDLTLQRGQIASTSDRTRGVFMGGRTPTTQNLIDYVTISSAGNALDFGDLAQPSRDASACSDSHGGLGGF